MRRTGGTSTGIGSVVVAIGLSQLLLAGDCVDGVTPDCSDAAAQCGPNVDAGGTQDASVPPDASTNDADVDAALDGDVDGAVDAGDQ